MIDISKITLENIQEYNIEKFKSKKDELLWKLKHSYYVRDKEMKNIGQLISLLRKEGYQIKCIPKVGYHLIEKEDE